MIPTRQQILDSINGVTGDPDTGVIHDIQPAIADAILALLTEHPEAKTQAQARETR